MALIGRFKRMALWAKLTTVMLMFGGLAFVALLGAVGAFIGIAWFGQPLPILGFEATFEQPISFPHTIHAGMEIRTDENGNPLTAPDGEMLRGIGLDCLFCHRTVDSQANAGVPPLALCSHCHSVIGEEGNADLEVLRNSAGIVGDDPVPINWRRVHRLPDHVRFAHAPHIAYLTQNPSAIDNVTDPAILGASEVQAASVCSTCHGDVAAMEQVFQVEALRMRQCVACHRTNNAPTGCETCHY